MGPYPNEKRGFGDIRVGMSNPQITKSTLKALADLAGIELDDDRIQEILPQVQRNAEAMASLDELDIDGIEPAITFRVES